MSNPQEMLIDGKPLSDLRVVDLKDQLDKRGLSKIGLKAELVARLLNALEMEQKGTNGEDQRNDSELMPLPPAQAPQAIKTRSAVKSGEAVSGGSKAAGPAPVEQKSVVVEAASAATTEAAGGQRGGGEEKINRTPRATRRAPAPVIQVNDIVEDLLPLAEEQTHQMALKYSKDTFDSMTTRHDDHVKQHTKEDEEDRTELRGYARGCMNERDEAVNQKDQLEGRVRNLNHQVNELQQEITNLRSQNTKLENGKKDQQKEIDQLNEELLKKETKLKEAEQAYAELETEVSGGVPEMENRMHRYRTQRDEQKERADLLQDNYAALEIELSTANAEVNSLKAWKAERERKDRMGLGATPDTRKRGASPRPPGKDDDDYSPPVKSLPLSRFANRTGTQK